MSLFLQSHDLHRQPLNYRLGYTFFCSWSPFRYRNVCNASYRIVVLALIWLYFNLGMFSVVHGETLIFTFSRCFAPRQQRDSKKVKAHSRICMRCTPATFWSQICIWPTSTKHIFYRATCYSAEQQLSELVASRRLGGERICLQLCCKWQASRIYANLEH